MSESKGRLRGRGAAQVVNWSIFAGARIGEIGPTQGDERPGDGTARLNGSNCGWTNVRGPFGGVNGGIRGQICGSSGR